MQVGHNEVSTLSGLCQAAVAAIAAASGAARLSFDVEAVRQRAETLLVAEGVVALPVGSVEPAADHGGSRLAIVTAHAAALVAAADLQTAIENLRAEVVKSEAVTRWRNALAPRAIRRVTYNFTPQLKSFARHWPRWLGGEYNAAWTLLESLEQTSPWLLGLSDHLEHAVSNLDTWLNRKNLFNYSDRFDAQSRARDQVRQLAVTLAETATGRPYVDPD